MTEERTSSVYVFGKDEPFELDGLLSFLQDHKKQVAVKAIKTNVFLILQ
jgi:hypothetical protein